MNVILKKKSISIFIRCVIVGIVFEILSILMYYGLWAKIAPRCRSACEIWPGIPISDTCILICLKSNQYYMIFFIIGLIFFISAIVFWGVLKFKKR